MRFQKYEFGENINSRGERKEMGGGGGMYLEVKVPLLPHLPHAGWYAFSQYCKAPCGCKFKKKIS